MKVNLKLCRNCKNLFVGTTVEGHESFECIVQFAACQEDCMAEKRGKRYVYNEKFIVPENCPFSLEQMLSNDSKS